jgi:hypothetical protein
MRRSRALFGGGLTPVALSLGLVIVLAAGSATTAGAATRLVRTLANAPGLTTLGLALDHSTRQGDDVIFEASEADLELLAKAGIPVDVVIQDVEAFYETRIMSERGLWQEAAQAGGDGFGFGSMGGYYTYAEVVAKLDEMRANYPQLITVRQSIAVGHEGRDVWMVKISDNADSAEPEPSMLITSLTHAREPQGMMTVLFYMFHLLENYGTDLEATYLVDNRQLYFVPVLNPDGYVYNQTINPNGGGMWRKNRRNNGGTFGVDLNRNYGYRWGFDNIGSSGSPSSDTYRGPSAFSEPETAGLRAFHMANTIWNAFHYHTYGNYEIHPFGYQASAFPPQPDRSYFQHYGNVIIAMNGYNLGNASQTVNYVTNGDAVDYCYGEQTEKNKVFGFTPEVGGQGDGFWPASSRIFPLAIENLGPNLYYSWITGAYVDLLLVTNDPEAPAGAISDVVVDLRNNGLGANSTDVTLNLASADPFVTIDEPTMPFPPMAPHTNGTNAADPLEFFVAGNAPAGHIISLDLTVRQGQVIRATRNIQVTVTASTGIGSAEAPDLTGLRLAAHPNPVGVKSDLVIHLPAAGPARLAVYDVAGRLRRTVAGGMLAQGDHRIAFDARDDVGVALPNGVYVARLEAAGTATDLRLVVLR